VFGALPPSWHFGAIDEDTELSLVGDAGFLASLLWVAGSAAALFAFLDSIASPAAKTKLYGYVQLGASAIDTLPAVAAELFERIFGKKHLSRRCLFASLVASLVSISALYILRALLQLWIASPSVSEAALFLFDELRFPFDPIARESFFISVAINLFLDYIALFKTRVIIKYLQQTKLFLWSGPALVVIDLFVSFFLFQIFYIALYFVSLLSIFLTNGPILPAADSSSFIASVEIMILLHFLTSPEYPAGTFYKFLSHSHAKQILVAVAVVPVTLISVFFYASLMPSIWLWLFVIAGLVARGMARVLPALIYALDFEQKPLTLIGLMLAGIIIAAGASIWLLGALIVRTLMWILS
jgi:hypothetical protein